MRRAGLKVVWERGRGRRAIRNPPIDFKLADIQARFDALNRRFFTPALPRIPLRLARLKHVSGTTHGTIHAAPGLTVTALRSAARYGKLRPDQAIVAVKEIVISTVHRYDSSELVGVLLHEMLHAHLMLNGFPFEGHGAEFLRAARELGARAGVKIPITHDLTAEVDADEKEVGVFVIAAGPGRPELFTLFRTSAMDAFLEAARRNADRYDAPIRLYRLRTKLGASMTVRVKPAREFYRMAPFASKIDLGKAELVYEVMPAGAEPSRPPPAAAVAANPAKPAWQMTREEFTGAKFPIRPALKVGPHVFIGKPGMIHAQILDDVFAAGPEVQRAREEFGIDNGWADRRGNFKTREEAEELMARAEKKRDPWAGHSGYVKQRGTILHARAVGRALKAGKTIAPEIQKEYEHAKREYPTSVNPAGAARRTPRARILRMPKRNPPTASAAAVVAHLKRVSGDADYWANVDDVRAHPRWRLARVPIASLEEGARYPDRVRAYARRRSSAPPVVLIPGRLYGDHVARQYSGDMAARVRKQFAVLPWWIVDGNHRIAAARARGKRTIAAWVPA